MLEVYYEQMSHEVLTESESYMVGLPVDQEFNFWKFAKFQLVNFVSDVGGQAGLWLGASILTLFEVKT